MEMSLKNNVIYFKGHLNEMSSQIKITEILKEAINNNPDKDIYVDFFGVDRANSCGIRTWVDVLKNNTVVLIYINSPEWLVEQFNCVKDLCPKNTLVASLNATFYCPEAEEYETKLLKIGVDIPILEDYEKLILSFKNAQNQELEPDFDIQSYFEFIVIVHELYKANLDKLLRINAE